MKKFTALLLALCVICALPAAQAAPMRDMRAVEIEISAGMKMLAETVLGAAVYTGTQGLEENLSPSAALTEAALALGLYNLSLPHDGEDLLDNRAVLTAKEAAALYALLFASDGYSLPEAASVAGVQVKDGQMEIDLSVLQDAPMTGVYIYSALLEEDTVELTADLFTYYGDFSTSAQDVPEDALTWLCNAEITLEMAPDTTYGYRVKRFALSERYEDGMLSDWQSYENTVCEYSVNIPSIFGLAEEDPAHPVWQTADGSAQMRIDRESLNGQGAEKLLEAYLNGHPGREIAREEELGLYYSTGEEDYQLWVILEGLEDAYHVSLQFPAERLAEYTLYSEFIRNSLIVWGISNG